MHSQNALFIFCLLQIRHNIWLNFYKIIDKPTFFVLFFFPYWYLIVIYLLLIVKILYFYKKLNTTIMGSIKTGLVLTLILLLCFSAYSQKDIKLAGTIFDENKVPVPYAAIGIPSKYIGTSSNDDGAFFLALSKSNLADTLEISSIGFKTIKTTVQKFINRKNKDITLEEAAISLDQVTILASDDYVKLAKKSLRKNMISKPHQLNVLYRRFSREHHKSRFLVEHYAKVIDQGPLYDTITGIQVLEGRKSVDYRMVKKKQPLHAINIMAMNNPLRQGIIFNKYNWQKIGDSSYDGEDIAIIQGSDKKKPRIKIKLHIGIDTKSIYKIQTTNLNAIYIYKKNKDGKLYLSYHSRESMYNETIQGVHKENLNLSTDKVLVSFRHEAIILGIETDKKKINIGENYGKKGDMGDLKVSYNPDFWANLSMPPASKFYKESVKELESVYGIELENQFRNINQ